MAQEPHRRDRRALNDVAASQGEHEAIPAATVVVLRSPETGPGLQVLMLHKHTGHAFGGMWVFPGGRVDPGDGADGDGDLDRARHAAVREAAEEAGVVIAPDDLVPFAHWTPPPEAPRRFATWFFVTEARDVRGIVVDGGEIRDHTWVAPDEALERHAKAEIELATPTWMTLHRLQRWDSPAAAVDAVRDGEVTYYETRIAAADGALVAMWEGDAGYPSGDPGIPGRRNRLLMRQGTAWSYERTV